MTDREIKYLLFIPIAVVAGLCLVPVYYYFQLPQAEVVLSASTLGAIFPKLKPKEYDPEMTKNEGDYPRFVRCALRINHEEGKRMAMRLAERINRDSIFPEEAVKEALYYPIRLRYHLDARRKIYLAFYASDAKYPSVDKACEGLHGKPCKELNEREAVLLAMWVEGKQKLLEKAKDDDAYLQAQIADIKQRCP